MQQISSIYPKICKIWFKSDIENRAYQVQRLLAYKLDEYKRRGNNYVDENIKEIQELYKKEGRRQ